MGKTSLVWRFSEDVVKKTYTSMIGHVDVKLRSIEIEGNHQRPQIWDTARQEHFHAISVSYYRTAMGRRSLKKMSEDCWLETNAICKNHELSNARKARS